MTIKSSISTERLKAYLYLRANLGERAFNDKKPPER
jgi:hypothetical protein